LFDGIKQCRRVATRYDKLAATYLVFVQLASIRLWLRVYESTPWSHICGNPFSLLCERHVDSDRDKGRIAWPVPKI
jgi:hypothetical protein